MSMTTLNISLPEKLRGFVEEKIARGGYGTISEYVRELIRNDEKSEQARFEAFIAEGFASGDPVPHTKADIEKARAETHRLIAARNKAK
jgi:antitoxin ParD1/3/4